MYSTLRPAAGPAGSLDMTIVNGRSLNGLVFGITVLLGLLLLPAGCPSARSRWRGVIGLVLAGVFLPTFSMQILERRAGLGGLHRGGAVDVGVRGAVHADAAHRAGRRRAGGRAWRRLRRSAGAGSRAAARDAGAGRAAASPTARKEGRTNA